MQERSLFRSARLEQYSDNIIRSKRQYLRSGTILLIQFDRNSNSVHRDRYSPVHSGHSLSVASDSRTSCNVSSSMSKNYVSSYVPFENSYLRVVRVENTSIHSTEYSHRRVQHDGARFEETGSEKPSFGSRGCSYPLASEQLILWSRSDRPFRVING